MRATMSPSSALRRAVREVLPCGRTAWPKLAGVLDRASACGAEPRTRTDNAPRAASERMSVTSALARANYPPKGGSCELDGPGRRSAWMLAAPLQPRPEEHLDRPCDGDRCERAEHARQLGSDQHGDEDGERRELHGPAVDDRLEDVVLDLLVDDEEHDQDNPGDDRVQEADGDHDDRRDRRPGERDQIEDT